MDWTSTPPNEKPPEDPGRGIFPSPSFIGTQCRNTNGWPTRCEDPVATIQPIISDYCYAPGAQTNVAKARAGHSIGQSLQSVNAAFADGHVETHRRPIIQWQYAGNDTAYY